jgi:hypothetical protein
MTRYYPDLATDSACTSFAQLATGIFFLPRQTSKFDIIQYLSTVSLLLYCIYSYIIKDTPI